MPFDLYGNYYNSHRDAENAELAQMAEINSRYALQQQNKNEHVYSQYLQQFDWQIQDLQERIHFLEKKRNYKRIVISQHRY
jgi:hypothetical protein